MFLPKEMICSLFSLWLLLSTQALGAADIRPEEIVTVLPKDAIPAIMSPNFRDGGKASWLRGKDKIVGVTSADESRAYPIATLSRHEIVNDKLGGLLFAVTW